MASKAQMAEWGRKGGIAKQRNAKRRGGAKRHSRPVFRFSDGQALLRSLADMARENAALKAGIRALYTRFGK